MEECGKASQSIEKDNEGGWVTSAIPRELSELEKQKLVDDEVCVSEFKQNKLEKEAKKNWDLFYKRNSTNFFKDRHWTTSEFEELVANTKVRWIQYMY